MIRLLFLFPLFLTTWCRSQTAETSFLVRTQNTFSLVSYGLGTDRLGGAKAGYVDSGVLFQVLDSVNDQYLVKLSEAHKAFINKSDVKRDWNTTQPPFYLTSSWSVKGDKVFDYVNISLDEKLPYKSWMEVNPSKICIDVYGVQSNSNWISQLTSTREVKNVSYTQVEDDVVRITIDLKHEQHWGYTIQYLGKILSVRIRRQPAQLQIKKLRIAVDAGHGGSNEGAKSNNGNMLEKSFTLHFANELKKYLEKKKVFVIMTRTTDTTISSQDRVAMLQAYLPDVAVSLHLNSSSNTKVKGVSTYYKHAGFHSLSAAILNRLLDLQLDEFGNIGNFNAAFNAPTDFPTSLIEIGFITNAEDEKKIIDPRFQKEVARKIYLGIKDWLRQIRR